MCNDKKSVLGKAFLAATTKEHGHDMQTVGARLRAKLNIGGGGMECR